MAHTRALCRCPADTHPTPAEAEKCYSRSQAKLYRETHPGRRSRRRDRADRPRPNPEDPESFKLDKKAWDLLRADYDENFAGTPGYQANPGFGRYLAEAGVLSEDRQREIPRFEVNGRDRAERMKDDSTVRPTPERTKALLERHLRLVDPDPALKKVWTYPLSDLESPSDPCPRCRELRAASSAAT